MNRHGIKECSPSRVARYRGRRRPGCNGGKGCSACWHKFYKFNPRSLVGRDAPRPARKARLPNKASALIRLALRDLIEAERSKKYDIEMMSWHTPTVVGLGFNYKPIYKCQICFAGSVMAFSLNAPQHKTVMPSDFSRATSAKLHALNEFRCGHLRAGLDVLGVSKRKARGAIRDCYVHDYLGDPDEFKNDMRDIASYLSERGL